jgi:hypothetical protein
MSVENHKELLSHRGHEIVIAWYGDKEDPSSVTIECERCGMVLLEPFYVDEETMSKDAVRAAAPDLLQACKDLLELYVQHAETCRTPKDCPYIIALENAEAAIDKAEPKKGD